MNRKSYLFTSESVGEGHPDKICDQISDAILDAALANDPEAHVACETVVGRNFCANVGEVTARKWELVDTQAIARQVCKDIGYDRPEEGFSYDTFNYASALHGQSPDIKRGVSNVKEERQGAGDQGMMFGYASNATPEFMPMPIVLSHRLLQRLQDIRKTEKSITYLRPDSKAQVSVAYKQGKPVEITTVVISHQTEDIPIKTVRADIEEVARQLLDPVGMLTNRTKFHINPTGRFVTGGPCGDSGVTGRKIIVDTYGGTSAHGGGAFSGKDPSKVDRSAAYYARYAAKNIVAAGLAEECQVQVAYAIGIAKPVSICVDTFGTGIVEEAKIERLLNSGEIFDFRPGRLIADLGLLKPRGWSYRDTVNYGHFGRAGFPWERTDRAAALRSALGLSRAKRG